MGRQSEGVFTPILHRVWILLWGSSHRWRCALLQMCGITSKARSPSITLVQLWPKKFHVSIKGNISGSLHMWRTALHPANSHVSRQPAMQRVLPTSTIFVSIMSGTVTSYYQPINNRFSWKPSYINLLYAGISKEINGSSFAMQHLLFWSKFCSYRIIRELFMCTILVNLKVSISNL